MNWVLDVDELNVEYVFGNDTNYQCICEFHNDTHPSMTVNVAEQFYYCFACGATGNIDNLLKVTGGTKKWILNNKPLKKDMNNDWRKKLTYPLGYGDEYLSSRNVTKKQILKFDIRANKEEVIFPLFDDNGNVVGMKIRLKKPRGNVKYLTFGHMPNYIANTMVELEPSIMVVEGMFGLLAFDRVGVPCMTPLSANRIGKLESIFKTYADTNFNLLFDNDVAGYMGAAKAIYHGRGYGNVYGMNVFCDVDKLSDEALIEISESDDIINRRTRVSGQILNLIKKDFGVSIFTDNKKKFNRFVKDNR